jgi:ABC-type transporter lipoprotein component MlaA
MAIGGKLGWMAVACSLRWGRAVRPERIRPAAIGFLALMLLAARPAAADPDGFNQANLRFNQWFLAHVMEPVARGYNFIIPKWGQRRVVAFMDNLAGPRNVVNSLAQAKVRRGAVHTGRFAVNTTVGIVGLFDVAEGWLHWTASPETLDETLGVWRLPPGSYLILPVLGSFCTRSLIGWVGDGLLNPLGYIPEAPLFAPTAGAYLLANVNLLAQGMPSPWASEGEWDAYRQSRFKFDPYDVGRRLFFEDEAERVGD